MLREILFKIIRKCRAWMYRHLSTLKPEGQMRRNDAVLFEGRGRVVLGEGNAFGYYPSPLYFSSYSHIEARHEDALIRIGNNNHFNNGLSIVAEHGNITIGNDCLVGTNVSIINSDFHPTSIANRHGGGGRKANS